MANIMVNDVCNMSPMCKYCFANKYVNGDTSTDISYENFKKAVDWINYSGDLAGTAQRIGLIGGEPLLHHKLTALIKYVLMQRRPNQAILVFTNGLILDKYADYFAKNDISVLINLNSPKDMGEKQYKRVVENIKFGRDRNLNMSVGINYYSKDLNTDFILSVIEQFNFRDLRLGIVCPNSPAKREEGAFAYFKEIEDSLLDFTEKAAALGCMVHMDCQTFPKCVLGPDDERVWAIRDKYRMNTLEFRDSGCHPVIDILTNLKAVRCFGCSDPELALSIENFPTEQDMIAWYETNLDNIGKLIAMDERCVKCSEKQTGRCQGGCLSYKIEPIKKIMRPLLSK